MIVFPHAKINIGLWITSKRADGYHDIATVFYPVKGLCDVIEFVVPQNNDGYDNLTLSGIPIVPEASGNLVLKVLALLRKQVNIPYLDIHLHKSIPPGAGLGGGSSDAASFLAGLNKHFGLGLSSAELSGLALSIGSDCPFFIGDRPVYAEGRGDKMTPLDFLNDELFILIVWTGLHISTREAYSKCTPKPRKEILASHFVLPPEAWREVLTNDFEETVFKIHPELGDIKSSLYSAGASYSSMSGSGSAVYGIFREKPVIPHGLEKMVVYSGLL